MALTETWQVAEALGRALTSDEEVRAELLLLTASACIQEKTGFRFEPGEHTIGRKVRGGTVRLPASSPEVTEVRYVNQTTGEATVATGWLARGATIYGLTECFAEVDFTVDADVPEEIAALAAGIVAGTLGAPPIGVSQEAMGPFNASFGNSTGRVFLTKSDLDVLARYKRSPAAVTLL